jgi:hypothetical protein
MFSSRSKQASVLGKAKKRKKEKERKKIHSFELSIQFFSTCCSSMHRIFRTNATPLIVESHWSNGLPMYTAPQSGRSCCSCQPQHGARPASFFRSIRPFARSPARTRCKSEGSDLFSSWAACWSPVSAAFRVCS